MCGGLSINKLLLNLNLKKSKTEHENGGPQQSKFLEIRWNGGWLKTCSMHNKTRSREPNYEADVNIF